MRVITKKRVVLGTKNNSPAAGRFEYVTVIWNQYLPIGLNNLKKYIWLTAWGQNGLFQYRIHYVLNSGQRHG